MKLNRSAILLSLFVASACSQRTDRPVSPPENTEQDRQSVAAQSPTSSIMRPEIVEEAGATEAPSVAEDLSAVVTFAQGAKLDDAARAALADLVAQPAFSTDGPITLSGHSDSSGSDAENLATSRRRAEVVRDHLISLGVEEDRITVIALGERRAISPNAKPDGSDDPEGRRRNRRVEIVVTSALSSSGEPSGSKANEANPARTHTSSVSDKGGQ